MKAAVIGTGWGQVHVRALRSHGVDVVALCGAPQDAARTTAAARELDVAVAVHDPGSLLALDLDLVTVAAPAEEQGSLLRTFADLPVVCEQPLLGMRGDPADLPGPEARVWVNCAFAFLDSARTVTDVLGRLGPVREVEVDVAHELPLPSTPGERFLELVSHPLSFVLHGLGAPVLQGGGVDGAARTTALDLACGQVAVRATCREQPGVHGIEQRLRWRTGGGEVELAGRRRRGEAWRYEPVLVNGEPVSAGEWTPEDCWVRANTRSIGTAVAVVRGELSEHEGLAAGLSSPAQAWAIDDCARAALGDRALT